jgi:hypothetical protein
VSKGLTLNELGTAIYDGPLSVEQRKRLLNLMMPIITGCRMFHGSRALTKIDKKETNIVAKQFAETVLKRSKEALTSGDLQVALIKPLNNLTSICRCNAWLLGNSVVKTAFLDAVGKTGPPDDPEFVEFRKFARPLGCPGCVFTQLVDEWRE